MTAQTVRSQIAGVGARELVKAVKAAKGSERQRRQRRQRKALKVVKVITRSRKATSNGNMSRHLKVSGFLGSSHPVEVATTMPSYTMPSYTRAEIRFSNHAHAHVAEKP